MASKYGMLPSEVLTKGNTFDMKFHITAEMHRDRQRTRQSGDVKDMAEKYTQSEIDEVYKNWQNLKSTAKGSKET